MVRDPVCGMEIAERDAYATRQLDGVQLSFCSAACVRLFDARPGAYSPSPAVAAASDTSASAAWLQPLLRPIAFGQLAVLGLLTFYLGIITLAQGWTHALEQLVEDRWFVGAIASGFGTQLGLFTYLKGLHAQAAAGGVAASTGASTTAMLACCAHHLADILPIVGLSGAAIFLNAYKTPLLWLGILMNLIGIVYLLRKIRQQHQMACHTPLVTRSI
jgi:YHS domain-containing protein